MLIKKGVIYKMGHFFFIIWVSLVCVTEQCYNSIFLTRFWYVQTALISETQNPEISGFQLRMRINTKPNDKQKWSEERINWYFCWLVTSLPMYLKGIAVRQTINKWRKSKRAVVLLHRQESHLVSLFESKIKILFSQTTILFYLLSE